jgi:two-component sensor histidine kinase
MKRESLGLHLVELLTDQINGILSIQSGKGTTFSVRFPQKRKG